MSAADATPEGLIVDAARRFDAAGLCYGHGTDNAEDEAAFLVLHALGLPFELTPEQAEGEVSVAARAAVERVVRARIETRKPAAYLTGRMWFAGHEFAVDERVLVPRSPLAELIGNRFQPWLGRQPVRRILDIGTGSGCIAIAAALAFPHATADATDISVDALAVARTNRERHALDARLTLHAADLFPPRGPRYDIIVSNPPYVPRARVDELPAEYRNEPRLGLEAGDDGMTCVDRILAHAADYLAEGGLLVVEVGEIQDEVSARHARLPFTWLAFSNGGEGVFVLRQEDLLRDW